jgi:hypothetical protein
MRYERADRAFALQDASPASTASSSIPTVIKSRTLDLETTQHAKRRLREMGSPEYLGAAGAAELNSASRQPERPPFDFRDGAIGFDVNLPPLSLTACPFRFETRNRG